MSNFIFFRKVRYHVKKQFYHINGVCVLTLKSHASGDRDQRSFISDRSLTKYLLHTTVKFSLLSIYNRRSVWLLLWLLGKHLLTIRP